VSTRLGHVSIDPPAPYLAALAQGLHFAPDTAPYLVLLDQAISDLKLTPEERAELDALAESLAINEAGRRQAHREYVEAATRDLVVTPDEHDQLLRAAALLGVDQKVVADKVDNYRTISTTVPLEPGLGVCFTGLPTTANGAPRSERFDVMASKAGLAPVNTVTKKACSLVVADDPATTSGKARKARQFGIPIAGASDFLASLASSAPLPVTITDPPPIALVCGECGDTWTAKRRSSKPLCSACR
jgi:hypothetical protein